MRVEHVNCRINQRGEIRSFIQDFIKKLTSVGSENVSLHRILARQPMLHERWETFSINHKAIQIAITKLSVECKEEILKRSYFRHQHYDSIMECYLNAVEKINSLAVANKTPLRESSTTFSTSLATAPSTVIHHAPRLPSLDLPKFNGNVSGLLPFKDMFDSMVISNPTLTPVYKMHYLKNCLTGSAARFINATSLAENNFEKTWDALQSFHENTRVLLSSAMTSAISMKRMMKDSAAELEYLYTTVTQSRQTIEALRRSMAGIDDFLIILTTLRFDAETIKAWEHHQGPSKDPPSWKILSEFITSRLLILKSYENANKPKAAASAQVPIKTHYAGQGQGAVGIKQHPSCAICALDHHTSRCTQYVNLPFEQRRQIIAKHKLCFNCLGPHRADSCKSVRRCTKCGKKHHSSIHQNSSQSKPAATQASTKFQLPSSSAHVHQASIQHHNCVLLATAKLVVTSNHGERCSLRALIDQGSEVSLISERVAQQLHLHRQLTSIPIIGVGSHSTSRLSGMINLKIHAHFDHAVSMEITAHILPKLTSVLPSTKSSTVSWPHLQGLQLADPEFYKSSPIDVIIGADVYSDIIEEGLIKGMPGTPTAQMTKLGWIISGTSNSYPTPANTRVHHINIDEKLHEVLQRFWALDEIPKASKSRLSRDEEACENHFKATHFTDETGRYVVRLPFKTPVNQLGDSRLRAQKMLYGLIKKFHASPDFQHTYTEFIEEYERLQHLIKLPISAPKPDISYYLPHHGVLKEISLTTKLRVVFNGSSQTTTGNSINDLLHSGAKIQTDLFNVLLFFRAHRYVYAADMEKFYHQVKLHPDDWKFQRILWYINQQVVTCELTTVTYGMVCAAFLALRTFQQLIEDEGHRFPMALPALTKGRYVDDIIGGADFIKQVREQIEHIIELCNAGGFSIQKWVSNHKESLVDVPEERRLTALTKSLDEDSTIHTLGLEWKPAPDTFHFNIKLIAEPPITKRKVLSSIAQIFDPLGFLAPVIIVAKIFIQEPWAFELKWDDEIAHELSNNWLDYVRQLSNLYQLSIPRWIGTLSMTPIEVHGFCDASQKALAAVVYVRTHRENGTIVNIICAKTKVSPLKRLTIPRLELSAAVLLMRLLKTVLDTMNWNEMPLFCWTDSSITHTWVNNYPSRWKEFVHNRVCLIQDTVPKAQWKFVPGKMSPADCATRGLTAAELISHQLWWNGPSWLSQSSEKWPNEVHADFTADLLEERPLQVRTIRTKTVTPFIELLNRCSTLAKLIRSTATCLRAVTCFKKMAGSSLYQKPLTPGDLGQARALWVKLVQREYFAQEIRFLTEERQLPKSSPIIRLTPRLDPNGILRVGGRLHQSNLGEDMKHSIILPRRSAYTTLVIRDAHQKTLHGGTQLTLSYTRNLYWIIGGRAPVRSLLLQCVPCTRYRQQCAQQIMAPLPTPRVTPSRAFLHSGVDYAGPFTIKTWRGRAAKTYKAYLALFVCLSTSAVHLELVSDYTTEAFIAAYKRFTARRGICATLRSDCGTNFKGAATELAKLLDASTKESKHLSNLLANLGTKWQFNPSSAPHFGGKWEAGVKSVKYHLRRSIGDHSMTYEEMTTLLTQIEAVLNSRPLCALTEDPDDLSVLTPGHFLIGEAVNLIPEPSLEHLKISRLSRWQLLRQLVDNFWSRWSRSYLQRHQSTYKWNQISPEVKTGDMVLVIDERYPPAKWPLGRILKTKPGLDGHTRIVIVRTKSTILERPIVKICPLPVQEDII